MAVQNVDLWVSSGNFDAPYYRFYTESSGSQELSNLSLDTSKSYTFRRLNEASSYPFYLSDTAHKTNSSNALLITGDGSPSQGITGNESFKVEFVADLAGSIEKLLYYCSSHQSMQGNIALLETTQEPEPEPTPETEPADYEPPATEKKLKGSKKDDILKGSKRFNLIAGKKGDDTLTGAKGDDVLKGGQGNDFLNGSKGNDYLDGSKGFDVLSGGKGADVFQISKGVDVVKDFSLKQGDRTALGKKGKYTIIDDPNGVLIAASAKKKIFLEGMDYGELLAVGIDLFVQPV